MSWGIQNCPKLLKKFEKIRRGVRLSSRPCKRKKRGKWGFPQERSLRWRGAFSSWRIRRQTKLQDMGWGKSSSNNGEATAPPAGRGARIFPKVKPAMQWLTGNWYRSRRLRWSGLLSRVTHFLGTLSLNYFIKKKRYVPILNPIIPRWNSDINIFRCLIKLILKKRRLLIFRK